MQPLAVDTHFLTAGDAGSPVEYRPLALRTGRSFEHWRVDACQGATPVASNVVVLHLPEHGPEHALREAATLGVVQRDAAQQLLVPGADATILDGFDVRAVTSLPADHSPLPRRRMELRTRDELPDHPATWAAVIAWASELAIAGTPDLRLRERTTRRIAASLDHVIQFHVDVDVRDWMPYDMTSTRLAHGRAFAEGGMFVDGALGASVSQELLMRLELDAATRLDPG